MHAILVFCSLLSLLVTASAISCYLCESTYEAHCSEDFEPENHFKLDCSLVSPPRYLDAELEDRNATACIKNIYKENGLEKIVRSCFFGDVNNTDGGCQMDPSLTEIEEIGCYVCHENFCNAATKRQAITWSLTAMLGGFTLVAELFNFNLVTNIFRKY